MKALTVMLASLFMFGCIGCSSGGSDEPAPTPKPEEQPKIEIPSSQANPVIAQEGGQSTLSFTTTANWTASVASTRAAGWCTVSPTSGSAGSVTLTITTTANDTYDERNATITLKAGSTSKSFTVKQKQRDALMVTSNKIELTADGGEAKVEIKANVAFNYEIAQEAKGWISAPNTRALTTTSLKFHVAENEEMSKREGKITIKSDIATETVTIYQEGAKPTMVLSQNEYTVASQGETIQIELKSNVDYEMSFSANWLSEATTRAISTHTHYIQVSPNEAYDPRTAEISFINKANNLEEKVKITQQQKEGLFIDKDSYEVKGEGGEIAIEVKANVSYTVSTDVEWIQSVTTRGLNSETLRFTISANSGKTSRKGTITLTAGQLTQTIKVTQLAPEQTGGGIDDMPDNPW